MDEQKKKMLMIGGVVALAVVIIIAAVMMDHKKKVEQSPMIVHTTTGPIIVPANTPVSTLPTTGVTTQGVTTTIPVTTRAVTTVPIPTLPPGIPGTLLYMLKTATTNGDFIGGNGGPISSGGTPDPGYYLKNNSDKNITSVNVTINNGYNNVGVWLYTVDSKGSETSGWDTRYQTTPIIEGSSTVGYTGTYAIPCNIAPGGAFIVNTSQTNGGSIKFNSVVFA
jgi:hypothetical protein